MAKQKKSKCQVTGPFASKAAATRKLNKKGSKLKGGFVARRGAYYIVKCPKGKGGKSLTAKAVAAAWGMPLLRLDMDALRSKYIGDSEANIRKALRVCAKR